MSKLKIFLLIGLLSIIVNINSYAAQKSFTNYSEYLSVNNLTFNYAKIENYSRIVSLGFLQNSSEVALKNIVIEVQYYNSNKKMIDTATQELYSMVIPPGENVSFSIKANASGEEKDYISHVVKVLSAEPKLKCKKASKKEQPLMRLLISLGPILLLILVWLFIARKYNSKNSHPAQSVELLKENNELITRQNELFERLVNAIETKSKES